MTLEVYHFDEERYLNFPKRKIKTEFGEFELDQNSYSWDYFYTIEYKKYEKFEKIESFTCVTNITIWDTENDIIIEETWENNSKFYSGKSIMCHSDKYGTESMAQRSRKDFLIPGGIRKDLRRILKLKELGID